MISERQRAAAEEEAFREAAFKLRACFETHPLVAETFDVREVEGWMREAGITPSVFARDSQADAVPRRMVCPNCGTAFDRCSKWAKEAAMKARGSE